MRQLYRLIERAAATRAPVLLLGETGTGKELVAHAIFDTRPAGQFVAIDCGTLVDTLLESELFGHTRGAFTGAMDSKIGLIELAHRGTAFLDEIGDLPLLLQGKLLRLLQEGEFRPVGGLRMQKVEVRIIAATCRDLRAEVAAGRFREDLYYRLDVLKIHVPPLRQRRADIPLLADYFLERMAREHRRAYQLSPATRAVLLQHDWPGNVRELQHSIEQMVTMHTGPVFDVGDLPTLLRYCEDSRYPPPVPEEPGADEQAPLLVRPAVAPLRETEKQAIIKALKETGGDRARAARLLQIGRTTLYRKLKEYGIPV